MMRTLPPLQAIHIYENNQLARKSSPSITIEVLIRTELSFEAGSVAVGT